MKRMLLLVFLAAGLLSGCAGTGGREFLGMMGAASFQNEPADFRGVKWGQDVKEISGLKEVSRIADGLVIYEREGDSLKLGDAQLSKIRYVFWDGKFMEVQMDASPSQYQAVKNVLFEKFGEGYSPYSPFSTIHDYSWSGPIAFVHLRNLTVFSNSEVWMKSRVVADNYATSRGEKAKAGAVKGAQKDF